MATDHLEVMGDGIKLPGHLPVLRLPMHRSKYFLLAALVLAPTARAADTDYVSSPYAALRYRDSTLQQGNLAATGHAHSLRLQLGYLWAFTPNVAVYAEGTHVDSLFERHFDDSSGRRSGYPVEADPRGSQISNLWLGYRNEQLGIRAGRQYLDLQSKRFISVSAWRQNPQSFDGISGRFSLGRSTTLGYDWVGRVNRTVGPDFSNVKQRRWKLDGHLLQLERTLPLGKLGGYGYFINNRSQPSQSTRTVGLRWTGREGATGSPSQLGWSVEFARQNDHRNNPIGFSLPYHLFEVDYGIPAIGVRLGEELLGSNGHVAVNVAMGSGHGFDGWVGAFAIPANGLIDRYGGVFGKLVAHDLTWQITYHDFQPHKNHGAVGRYGHEIDLGLKYTPNKRLSLELQYGDYRARSHSVNQRKLWLLAEYRYGKQPQ